MIHLQTSCLLAIGFALGFITAIEFCRFNK